MPRVADVAAVLEEIAPLELAEDWDNTGLLVGDSQRPVRKIMTCLTVTPATTREAVEGGADLVVTHHPLPFRPLATITTETTEGRMLLDLIGAGLSLYSAHTAFDSARRGINRLLAEGLGLQDVRPLVPREEGELGAGRLGAVVPAAPLSEIARRLIAFFGLEGLHVVGRGEWEIRRLAIACGSAGEFLEPALEAGCDALLTGEASFHRCLAAEARELALLLPGHYATERFAMERLAGDLAARWPELEVWASREERDPLSWWS